MFETLSYSYSSHFQKLYETFRMPVPPTLVFVEADTGKLINKSGRFVVEKDKTGENFPWHPRTLSDILSGPVLSNSEEVDLEDARKDKVLGIYFSAEWVSLSLFVHKCSFRNARAIMIISPGHRNMPEIIHN